MFGEICAALSQLSLVIGSGASCSQPLSIQRPSQIDASLDGFDPGPEGWVGQLAGFDAALRSDAEPPVTLADARAGLELATACYRSARTGADVHLPLSEDHPDHAGWQP